MLPERLLAFAAAAPGMQTKKALVASFTALIESLGATRFACIYLKREGSGVAIERGINNLPRLWQELYLERGFDAVDPVLLAAMRGAWGYWNELLQGVHLSKAAREVMTSARDFDMKDGFTKRIALDMGGTAVMMCAGAQLTRNDRARAAFRLAFEVFANEGARMLKMADELGSQKEDEKKDLSKTQLRVLVMRSEGMSNKQVAQVLGRHEKTVECHVTEILRRLGARNMIDAIRIATRRKLIL